MSNDFFKSMNKLMIVNSQSNKDVLFSFNLIKAKVVDILCLKIY